MKTTTKQAKKLSEIWNGRDVPQFNKEHLLKKIKITVNGKRLNVLPLRSRTRQECSLSLLLFNVAF